MSVTHIGSKSGHEAQIWLNELPAEAGFDCSQIIEGNRMRAYREGHLVTPRVAAEVLWRQSHDTERHYVLLGGQYTGAIDGEFHVEACAGHRAVPAPDWTLEPRFWESWHVTAGLPMPAARVSALVPLSRLKDQLPPGTFRVTHSLYSEFTADRMVAGVTEFLIQIALQRVLPDDEWLVSALGEALSGPYRHGEYRA